MKKLGIYIHVPFCKQKCNYCDFYSVKLENELENSYIAAIINEINSYNDIKNNYIVDTIFFGGGTPTILKPYSIRVIMDKLKEDFVIDKSCEISIEANPNTLTNENLSEYKDIGINRLSIGIQSLNDDILKLIGRIHNSKQALEAIDNAKKVGFTNINADVMFNIPGQTVNDIEETIKDIIKKDVKHISFYSLKLEKKTPMYAMEKNNKITMPDEDAEREMYYTGRKIMEQHNLFQYEISNFTYKNYECKHNLRYWNQQEYIGLGPSAHSFLNNIRFSNSSDLNWYCKNSGYKDEKIVHERLNNEELLIEFIMLQLRLTKGININQINEKFSFDFCKKYELQINYLLNNQLIELDDEYVRLSKKGMDLSNYVIEQFM